MSARDLVGAVRAEARRLYAPTPDHLFPSRVEFNQFARMVMELCDVADRANPDTKVTITVEGNADPQKVAQAIREQLTRDGLVYTQRGAY